MYKLKDKLPGHIEMFTQFISAVRKLCNFTVMDPFTWPIFCWYSRDSHAAGARFRWDAHHALRAPRCVASRQMATGAHWWRRRRAGSLRWALQKTARMHQKIIKKKKIKKSKPHRHLIVFPTQRNQKLKIKTLKKKLCNQTLSQNFFCYVLCVKLNGTCPISTSILTQF